MSSRLNRLLPHREIKNVSTFYLLTILTNGYFINANWIFLALSLMNKAQLGLIDGISFVIGNIVDLPSGAIADIIGRKRTIIVARAVFALGCLMFVFSYSITTFFIANILFFIGLSFYGGADQALLYDSLKARNLESEYLSIATKNDLLSKISIFTSSLIGAFAFSINIRLPFLLLFIAATFALFISFSLEEIAIGNKRSFSFARFLSQQLEGLKVLLSSKTKYYFPLFFVILGSIIIYNWGILRGFIALKYGFGGTTQTLVFGTLSLITGLLALFLPKIVSKSSDFKVAVSLSVVFALGFLLASSSSLSKSFGLLTLFTISLSGGALIVLSQKIVNEVVPSNLRATALSALSIITKIPYALTAFSIGLLAQSNSLNTVTFTIFLLSLIAVIMSVILNKTLQAKKLQVNLS